MWLSWLAVFPPRPKAVARWAWILVGVAYSLYFLGDALWALFELVQKRSPFPSAADGLYLAFYPVLLGGLLMLPGPLRKRNEWGRLGLDVLTVTIAGSMTVWYLVIGPTLEQGSGTSLSTILSLAYPVGDLILVFGIATVIVRGVHPGGSVGLRWMALGAVGVRRRRRRFRQPEPHQRLRGGKLARPRMAGRPPVLRDRGGCRTPSTVPVRPPEPANVAGTGQLASVRGHRLELRPADPRRVLADRRDRAYPARAGLALTATVVARQVTAVRDGTRMTDELQWLATTDPLTSLSNRRHLLDAADHEFSEAQRHHDDLAVIFIDVDHFKSINDAHGHAVGDAVLIWLSEQLRSIFRDKDLIGRFGGDEFIAIVPGLGADAALSIANRLERSIATLELAHRERPAEDHPQPWRRHVRRLHRSR